MKLKAILGLGALDLLLVVGAVLVLGSARLGDSSVHKSSPDEPVAVDVRFEPGVPLARASGLLRSLGVECAAEAYLAGNRLIVEAPLGAVRRLLASKEVAQIDPAMLYTKRADTLSVKRMRVERVLNKKKYRRPSGDGVLVGVTDSWIVDEDHVELDGRVIVVHDTSSLELPEEWADRNHGTFIAGTIAAAGLGDPLARGVAPSAGILSFIIPFDPVGEMKYAADRYGMRISANSWSYDADTESLPVRRLDKSRNWLPARGKTKFGYYTNFNHALDEMVARTDVLSIWAAGNESDTNLLARMLDEMGKVWRPDRWHRDFPEFDRLTVSSNSKNVLAIGATHKDDVITGFSSRGPAWGGRIGPHLVAPGFRYYSTNNDDTYGYGSGTSGSCPMVAGVAALLLDQYRKIHGADPSSALIKALLINSARDLGIEGPDYVHGYGLVDAELAAKTVAGQEGLRKTKAVRSRFVENNVHNGEEQAYSFEVPRGRKELRVTLVWHDPPGRRLVNDLDISARFGNDEVLPFVPDPAKPLVAATTGRNFRDNVEHLLVKRPRPGAWTVVVKGTRVRRAPQDYALVIAAGKGHRLPTTKTGGDFTLERVVASLGDFNQPQTQFRIGDPVTLHALLDVHENASYAGGYYGTVSGRFELRDEAGNLKFVLLTSMENLSPSGTGELRELPWSIAEIPDFVPTGTFRVRTTVTMHNGVTETAAEEIEITVE
ncbi:MAG: S8 family serine peptidase [bacterium]|nr:S8 family serine peptidase [bacterium]